MSEDKKTTEPIDFSDLGGRKIDHHVPEKSAEPIDLSHLGGKRVCEPVTRGDSMDDEAKTGTNARTGSVRQW